MRKRKVSHHEARSSIHIVRMVKRVVATVAAVALVLGLVLGDGLLALVAVADLTSNVAFLVAWNRRLEQVGGHKLGSFLLLTISAGSVVALVQWLLKRDPLYRWLSDRRKTPKRRNRRRRPDAE
jgi:hypothetical protein